MPALKYATTILYSVNNYFPPLESQKFLNTLLLISHILTNIHIENHNKTHPSRAINATGKYGDMSIQARISVPLS